MPFSQKMLSFEGRLRRRDYWLCSLALGVGFVFLYCVLVAPLMVLAHKGGDPLGPVVIQSLLILVAQWPAYAIAVKRCHDRDQSGWMMLIQFIPLIGGFWGLINLGLLDGTYGPNRFGQSPKDPDYGDERTSDVFA